MTLPSPRDLLRGVVMVRLGAQGAVKGLLLRAGAGAACDRIFCRFSVAWLTCEAEGARDTSRDMHLLPALDQLFDLVFSLLQPQLFGGQRLKGVSRVTHHTSQVACHALHITRHT